MTGPTTDLATESLDADVPATLYLPPDADAAPGVVLLHGSDGEPLDRTATLLAEAGFAAAAVQYFGAGADVRDHLDEVPVEGLGSVTTALADHAAVAGESVGLYGASKGAELALVAGVHLDDVAAVVSVGGSNYVWEGLHRDWSPTGTSSWSVDGEPLPYVPFAPADAPGESIRASYESAFDHADPGIAAAATIPVEEIGAPLLFVTGERDRMWPSTPYAEAAMARLEERGYEHATRHLSFAEAGHAIGPPGPRLDELDEQTLEMLGGTLEGARTAAEEGWPEIRSFLATHC